MLNDRTPHPRRPRLGLDRHGHTGMGIPAFAILI